MKKKIIIRTLLVIVLIAALSACAWCVWYLIQYRQGQSFGEEIRESGPQEPVTISIEPEEETEEPRVETIDIPVDFDGLHEINPDIYAWIEVPGTDISYAVLHREGNNSYYIRRSEDGSYYTGGCIFSEDYNSTDFSDKVTVLYGHNLKSGRMFAKLNDFADVEVFDEYRYIHVYLPDRALVYKIFAACPHSKEHLLAGHDYDSEEEFDGLISDILGTRSMDAQFREDEYPTFDDQVLVLSTCYRQDKYQRYLVCARLVKEIPASQASE